MYDCVYVDALHVYGSQKCTFCIQIENVICNILKS